MDNRFEKVVRRLEKEYEKAQKLEFVQNPLAYALYKVWKMVDRGEIQDAYVRGYKQGRRDALADKGDE